MEADIYQTGVLKHAAASRAHGRLTDPDVTVTLDNPLCGDRVTVDINVRDGAITDFAQDVKACALCQASISIFGGQAAGESLADVTALRVTLEDMLKAGGDAPAGKWQDYDVFRPVIANKSRHRCVLLPFEAIEDALANFRIPPPDPETGGD